LKYLERRKSRLGDYFALLDGDESWYSPQPIKFHKNA
jgi:hypothetical protein